MHFPMVKSIGLNSYDALAWLGRVGIACWLPCLSFVICRYQFVATRRPQLVLR